MDHARASAALSNIEDLAKELAHVAGRGRIARAELRPVYAYAALQVLRQLEATAVPLEDYAV